MLTTISGEYKSQDSHYFVQEATFGQIIQLWQQYLWPGRCGEPERLNPMRLGGGYDLAILKNIPDFLAAYDQKTTSLVGAVTGFATADSPKTYRVRGLIVHPEHRNRGVGALLVRALLDHARALGFVQAWTAPRPDNLAFYERMGFKKVSDWTHEGFESGPNCYAVVNLQSAAAKETDQTQQSQLLLHPDAFSSGQILSKLWLCEQLEAVVPAYHLKTDVLWTLCGWYGLLPFLLLSRDRLKLRQIRSFDWDPEATRNADRVMNAWEWQGWKFKAIQQDITKIDYGAPQTYFSHAPDVVINCATEHFAQLDWWERIPAGKLVVLQGTDMANWDHKGQAQSLSEFEQRFVLQRLLYAGEKTFCYEDSGLKFSRWMVIGVK